MKLTRRKLVLGIPATAAAAGLGWLSWPGASTKTARPRARGIASDPTIPKRADVVVVGGGNVGVNAAFCLAERGLSVALCEKGVIAGEASGRSLGWIQSLFSPPVITPLVLRSKHLWDGLNARVGLDTSYRRTGLAMLCINEAELQHAQSWIAAVRGEPGFDPQLLSRNETEPLMRSAATSWLGALYQASDAIADPRLFSPAVAEGARRKGATIHQNCAVRGIETSAGKVSAAVTEKGSIRTDRVILAGGYWSTAFCRNFGIDLPQLPTYSSVLSVAPFPGGPIVSGTHGNVGWRIEPDGGYSLGRRSGIAPIEIDTFRYGSRFIPALRQMWPEVRPALGSDFFRSLDTPSHWKLDETSPFEQNRVLEPDVWASELRGALRDLQSALPAFAGARLREEWAGVIVDAADALPILGPVPSPSGLILGTAISFGLRAAPAIGELLADFATGAEPKFDPRPFRYERLIDGSTLPLGGVT